MGERSMTGPDRSPPHPARGFDPKSTAGMMIGIALVSLALAPLAYPTDACFTALMYFKVGGLVAATFGARYAGGRAAAWWFGFATLGWANLVISVPGLWNGVNVLLASPELALNDLAASAADQIDPRAEPILRFWFALACSLAGGWASVAIDRRSEGRRPPFDEAPAPGRDVP